MLYKVYAMLSINTVFVSFCSSCYIDTLIIYNNYNIKYLNIIIVISIDIIVQWHLADACILW